MEKRFIYCYTNKINGHKYIGQTNDLEKRHRGHKSDANNKNSHSYNYPFHAAIRKYGIDNFSFDVIDEALSIEESNKKEIYWIEKCHSHISQGGYNITRGGDGHNGQKVPWEMLVEKGKVFTAQEIIDIQNKLIAGAIYNDLIEEYKPRLTRTFLSNLNHGTNYKNPNLDYPLKKDFKGEKSRFSNEEIQAIKNEIKKGTPYSQIQSMFNIKSAGFISGINSGKYFFDKSTKYPLVIKGCADKSWIIPCIKDIVFSSDSLAKIAQKYGKAESTIKKLGQGRANKQDFLIYPLRSNQEQNQEIFLNHFSK